MIIGTVLLFLGSKWYIKTPANNSVIERYWLASDSPVLIARGFLIFFKSLFATEEVKRRAETFFDRAKFLRDDEQFLFQEEEVSRIVWFLSINFVGRQYGEGL